MLSWEALELRQLQCFVQVVRCGSISRAALESGVSQPALSLRIKKLEALMGVQLLHRNGRGVVATATGLTLYERIRPLLEGLELAVVESCMPSRQLPAEVVIGVVPTLAHRVSDALTSSVHPDAVSFRIVEGFSGHLRNWLTDGEVDLAVCTAMFRQPGIKQVAVGTEPLELVGVRGGAKRKEIPFGQLSTLPLIVGSARHTIRRLLERTASEQDIHLKIAYELDGLEAQLRFAAKGAGFAVLPRGTVSGHGYTQQLGCWPIVEPQVRVHIVVASLPQIETTKPYVAAMRDELVKRIKGQGFGAPQR